MSHWFLTNPNQTRQKKLFPRKTARRLCGLSFSPYRFFFRLPAFLTWMRRCRRESLMSARIFFPPCRWFCMSNGRSPESAGSRRKLAACLVIDDPLLRPRYGLLNFQHLLNLMSASNFSTSIAFIPWNCEPQRAENHPALSGKSEEIFALRPRLRPHRRRIRQPRPRPAGVEIQTGDAAHGAAQISRPVCRTTR